MPYTAWSVWLKGNMAMQSTANCKQFATASLLFSKGGEPLAEGRGSGEACLARDSWVPVSHRLSRRNMLCSSGGPQSAATTTAPASIRHGLTQAVVLMPGPHCRVPSACSCCVFVTPPLCVLQEARMQKTVANVADNFNTMRTGRANPAILDRIQVGVTSRHPVRQPVRQSDSQSARQPVRKPVSLCCGPACSTSSSKAPSDQSVLHPI